MLICRDDHAPANGLKGASLRLEKHSSTLRWVCRSIVDFASNFKKKNMPLHVLVENAGVFLVPFDRTQEGFETTVGTNYFGDFHQPCRSCVECSHTAFGLKMLCMHMCRYG